MVKTSQGHTAAEKNKTVQFEKSKSKKAAEKQTESKKGQKSKADQEVKLKKAAKLTAEKADPEVKLKKAKAAKSAQSGQEADKADKLLFKTWSCHSGELDWPDEAAVRVRKFAEYGKSMMQVKCGGVAMITLTNRNFGDDRTEKIIELVRGMVLRGFSKSQINTFKSELLTPEVLPQ